MGVKFRPVTSDLLGKINARARKCQRERHRPTVAAVVICKKTGKILVVESAATSEETLKTNPGIVKVGMNPQKEDALTALFREIKEEVFLSPDQLRVTGYGGSRSVRSLKRKGRLLKKRYFFFLVEYDGVEDLTINTSELSGYFWLTIKQARKKISVLKETRLEKFRALDAVFKTVSTDVRRRSEEPRIRKPKSRKLSKNS